MKEETKELIVKYSVIIFPIVAVWFGAYLNETPMLFGEWYCRFLDTSYAFAYIVTVVIIELKLIWTWLDW